VDAHAREGRSPRARRPKPQADSVRRIEALSELEWARVRLYAGQHRRRDLEADQHLARRLVLVLRGRPPEENFIPKTRVAENVLRFAMKHAAKNGGVQ